jgi:hypothetical protein
MPGRLRRPLSCSSENRNCRQETGSPPILSTVNMGGMSPRFPTRPVQGCVPLGRLLLPLLLLFMQWIADRVHAHAAVVATPRITLVVFADKEMPVGEWDALFRDLRQDYSTLAAETYFSPGGFNMVRGDALLPGIEIDSSISIYLHGECTLLGQPGQSVPQGTLGWVLRNHGHIEPFIHVDCTRIREILGNYAQRMNHDLRNSVMAEAISRVVLHEWIHVVTQSPLHKQDGVSKSAFRIADLIPSYYEQFGQVSHGK